jgi:tetratricopeptide (TPR) repeat protein
MASGRNEDAIAHFTRALDCWRRITSHRRAEAINHRHLGRALSSLGRASEADEHLHTALAIFTELGENYHQARTLYVIAMTRLASGRPDQAVEAISRLERALPLMEAEDHPLSLSELLTALGTAHARTGNTGQAAACLDRAADLQQQLNLPESHPARVQTSFAASQLR